MILYSAFSGPKNTRWIVHSMYPAVSTTPILGRKFEDLLTLTPGVSVVQGPDGDEITFAKGGLTGLDSRSQRFPIGS